MTHHRSALSPIVALLLAGCGGQTIGQAPPVSQGHLPAGATAFGTIAKSAVASNSPGLLHYFGGPVVSNINVYQVDWNHTVSPQVRDGMPGFYSAVTSSELFDWLDGEYATTLDANDGSHKGQAGTNQHIQRGRFGGHFTLSETSRIVQDADVRTALTAAIHRGA